jgi:hypothetical protein
MGTFVDPAIVDYQFQITDCVKHSSDPDCRWPTSSDYQLRIVENERFAISVTFVSSATFQKLMKYRSGLSARLFPESLLVQLPSMAATGSL